MSSTSPESQLSRKQPESSQVLCVKRFATIEEGDIRVAFCTVQPRDGTNGFSERAIPRLTWRRRMELLGTAAAEGA